ncbi:hypothetical protein NP233_g10161 [Leucocoprinus birnbaumii]|uniref:Nephrocystin 3-like N-terminal domain-containing protein n=1 Tax=Leucocoprinus birnbaumii TaxID=56174 RepID=A0AAD5VJ27_9AGAR|nr:hypothetical protein NP233_g10161 [Leucocoprinus birnbaumii]
MSFRSRQALALRGSKELFSMKPCGIPPPVRLLAALRVLAKSTAATSPAGVEESGSRGMHESCGWTVLLELASRRWPKLGRMSSQKFFSAAFFFSRANGWNQPLRFFPTLAYQLATRYDSYRAAIDAVIARDPLVLEMSLEAQFRELFVKPLRELSADDRNAIEDTIIIVDGLDECGPINAKLDHVKAQETIIKLITTAAASRNSPFLWGVVSRPESHIVSAFASKQARTVTWHLTLPLRAPNVDEDITSYLRDAFATICLQHPSLSPSWPSEDSLVQLVKDSDGLFAYASSAARYIERGSGLPSESRLGPEERLQSLLEPSSGSRASFSKLDQLYLLIMDQIPKAMLPNTLIILCATHRFGYGMILWKSIPILSSLFGMSDPAFYSAISPLCSVLQATRADNKSYPFLKFYHASFTDFLTTLERSTKEYYIYSDEVLCLLCSASLDALLSLPSRLERPLERYMDYVRLHECKTRQDETIAVGQLAMVLIFILPGTPNFPAHFQPYMLEKLTGLDWNAHAMAYLNRCHSLSIIKVFAQKIPRQLRSQIINSHNIILKAVWVLFGVPIGCNYVVGKGAKRALFSKSYLQKHQFFELTPYPKATWRRITLYFTI